MKKYIGIAITSILLMSCASEQTIDGKQVEPYGLFNRDTKQDTSVMYDVSAGSAIVGIVFSETIIVPVYIVGWDLYQPVKAKH